MNKTTIKKKHKTHKNNIQYRKLRRWVLPAVLGAALSTLAFIPTFAAETQANTNVAVEPLQNKLQLYHLLKVAHHQMVRHMANHLQVNRQ